MEEWVGQWWHRAITRVADRSHPRAAVDLAEVQHAIGLLFRAAGGAPAVRVTPGGASTVGGPRGWLQRVAGSGERAALPELGCDVLALPPRIAVFAERALNRDLYLWLAALSAQLQPQGDWLADNLRASAAALRRFPGLRGRHARLVQAHLAQRPRPEDLRGAAALAERAVQAALRSDPHEGEPHSAPLSGPHVLPRDVAPVCLWLLASPEATAAQARADAAARPDAARTPSDATRRQAERVDEGAERAPFMLFFRAESLLSWGELVRVNRATDDDPDDQASAAANDMDKLSVAPDGAACASRVKFDLDLPSAAADDLPLGPGIRLPEWDCRRGALRPDHCSVQTFVARPDSARPAWQPSPALQRIARQVQRRLEVLRSASRWARAQEDGEAIDLDAWVRHATERGAAQRSSTPAVYARRVPHERSLATLLLADLSLSTDAHVNNEQRVIDVIRDALWVFGEALQAGGDAFAMLGFSSVRRQHVRVQHLLGFAERWDDAARARVAAIKPGYYTRMGAAIRLATRQLAQRPERQRLLLLLTDGKPNDLDVYEGRYGLEDTRHAVAEARAAGLTPFCISIDEGAQDYLPALFGRQGFVQLRRPTELPLKLAGIHARLARQG